MSEAYLDINFECQSEHVEVWNTVLSMFQKHQFNSKLQEVFDAISKPCADALDDVLDKFEMVEVFDSSIDGTSCYLKLMTGGMEYESLIEHFVGWLKTCPVKDVKYEVSFDD